MYKSAYHIVTTGIRKRQTFKEVHNSLRANLVFGCGFLGEFPDTTGETKPFYALYTNALGGLFENGGIEAQRDEQITGEEPITVSIKKTGGWSICFGHLPSGNHFQFHHVINHKNFDLCRNKSI